MEHEAGLNSADLRKRPGRERSAIQTHRDEFDRWLMDKFQVGENYVLVEVIGTLYRNQNLECD